LGPTVDQSVRSTLPKTLLDNKAAAGGLEEKRVPRVGEGVQIDARDGVFVVLRTDASRGTVDVLQVSGVRQIEGGVPIGSVRILHGVSLMDELKKTKD